MYIKSFDRKDNTVILLLQDSVYVVEHNSDETRWRRVFGTYEEADYMFESAVQVVQNSIKGN